MRLLILLIIYCLYAMPLTAQNYQVIKVSGLITHCKKGDTLRMKDKIKASDSLCFVNTENRYAVAALINSESKARYLIKPSKKEKGTHKNSVKDILIQSRSLSGTRHGGFNTLLDLQTFLGKEDFLILGGKLQLQLNEESLAMNADSFFFFSFNYQEETINKKLSFEGNMLSFSADELFRIDGLAIEASGASDFCLYYLQPALKQKRKVAAFTPLFLPDDQAKEELNIISRVMGETNTDSLKQELAAYLIEVYGKADEDNLNAWLNEYIGTTPK